MDKDTLKAIVDSLPIGNESKTKILEASEPIEVIKQSLAEFEKHVSTNAVQIALESPEKLKPFIEEATTKTRAEMQGIFNNQFRSEFPELDLKNEDGSYKSYRQLFQEQKELFSKKSGKGSDELQNQLIELRAQLEKKDEEYQSKIKEVETSYAAKEKRQLAKARLKDFLGDTQKLAISEHLAMEVAEGYLDRSFSWGLDDNGEFYIKKKDGSPVTNEAGSAKVQPAEIIGGFLKAEKLIKESNGDPGNGQNRGTTTQVTNDPNSPELDRLAQHIASLEGK